MKIGRSLIVFILQVFTDDGILVLLDAQVEVTARIAYIIRITRESKVQSKYCLPCKGNAHQDKSKCKTNNLNKKI